MFLWHFPSLAICIARAWALPSPLPGGARTFLPDCNRSGHPVHLAGYQVYYSDGLMSNEALVLQATSMPSCLAPMTTARLLMMALRCPSGQTMNWSRIPRLPVVDRYRCRSALRLSASAALFCSLGMWSTRQDRNALIRCWVCSKSGLSPGFLTRYSPLSCLTRSSESDLS